MMNTNEHNDSFALFAQCHAHKLDSTPLVTNDDKLIEQLTPELFSPRSMPNDKQSKAFPVGKQHERHEQNIKINDTVKVWIYEAWRVALVEHIPIDTKPNQSYHVRLLNSRQILILTKNTIQPIALDR